MPDGGQFYPALVLNADFRPLSYFPLSLWSWQDAVKAVFLDRVSVLSEYETEVRSPSVTMKLPSVIALKDYIPSARRPAFTRFNVFLRDAFVCQYLQRSAAGARPDVRPRGAAQPRRAHDLGERRRPPAATAICARAPGCRASARMFPRAHPRQPTTWELQDNGRALPAQLPARELARLSVLGQRAGELRQFPRGEHGKEHCLLCGRVSGTGLPSLMTTMRAPPRPMSSSCS